MIFQSPMAIYYYILLVNYEVLLHSVKEKTNSTEPSGTGIMLQLVEGSLIAVNFKDCSRKLSAACSLTY